MKKGDFCYLLENPLSQRKGLTMKVLDIINDFGLEEIREQRLPIPNIDYKTLFELVTHPKFAKT